MPDLNICVDDVGLGSGVSEAVVRLSEVGVLGSASCMVNVPHAGSVPAELGKASDGLDLGLHFNLTCGGPLGAISSTSTLIGLGGGFLSFGRLAACAYMGRVSKDEIAQELTAQWERFCEIFGREPAHLDGHHHVHQLPVIRDAVVGFAAKVSHPGFYVRNSAMTVVQAARQGRGGVNAFWIGRPGQAMRRTLREHRIPTNERFAGVIPLGLHRFDRLLSLFERCLRAVGASNCLFMTHASVRDPGLSALDGYVEGRFVELDVLASTDLRHLVQDLRFTIRGGV
jgi:predicted glycoside hydrolase/deacetylase ChbG (UPF0249 family)